MDVGRGFFIPAEKGIMILKAAAVFRIAKNSAILLTQPRHDTNRTSLFYTNRK